MELSITLAQRQILSQNMRLSTEILQMSTLSLVEYLQELSMENPVLEWEEPLFQESFDRLRKKIEWLGTSEESGVLWQERNAGDWHPITQTKESLPECLLSQIHGLTLPPEQLELLFFLIESVGTSGYLEPAACTALQQTYQVSLKEAKSALALLQGLEPAGVGARNLKECLLLQLRRMDPPQSLCERIVKKYLDALAKNQLHQIARELGVKLVEVVRAKEIIQRLNPKPGSGFFTSEETIYLSPDAVIHKNGDELIVTLDEHHLPKLQINGYYRDVLLTNASGSAKEYIVGKLRQAEWIKSCIAKRQDTLRKTVEAIVAQQEDFFREPTGELVPMRLTDIAQQLQMHESTISRAIRDKYLQCDRGVFLLSYFFTTGVATAGKAEGQISAESIKNRIRVLLQEEDKAAPLSDQRIMEALVEEGIQISRRTVTKYREAMQISGAAGRRHFFDQEGGV